MLDTNVLVEVLLRPEFNFLPARVHEVIDFVWRYAHRPRALVTGNLRHYPADRRQGMAVLMPREFLGAWTHGGAQS